MAENSPIEWTDHTWSPWEGCTKVGPGCDHCYAEGMNRWLRKGANWGPGAPRREYSDAHRQKPLRWNAAAAKAGTRPKVFPSVCDPFDNEVPREWRLDLFNLIEQTPHLEWLLLTKRIGNAAAMLADVGHPFPGATLPHVRMGATMVNQEEWDRDIRKLLAVNTINFVSLEPLLGPIDMGVHGHRVGAGAIRGLIDWVIAGGESGPGARPAHPDWFRSLRDQCAAAGVPFLFKQWGEWAPGCGPDGQGPVRHSWPRGVISTRIGKKAAGRLLDGVTHDGMPKP